MDIHLCFITLLIRASCLMYKVFSWATSPHGSIVCWRWLPGKIKIVDKENYKKASELHACVLVRCLCDRVSERWRLQSKSTARMYRTITTCTALPSRLVLRLWVCMGWARSFPECAHRILRSTEPPCAFWKSFHSHTFDAVCILYR